MNKYVYSLIDESEGEIGIFTSIEKAVKAAIENGLCESYYDDEITTPQQVFTEQLMMIERIPLNTLYY